MKHFLYSILLVLFIQTPLQANDKLVLETFGVGISHLSKAERTGFYMNGILEGSSSNWGFIINGDVYNVDKTNLFFLDGSIAFFVGLNNFKIYPYAGPAIAIADEDTGSSYYETINITGVKFGITYGSGASIILNRVVISSVYGYHSMINTGMLRFAIGLML